MSRISHLLDLGPRRMVSRWRSRRACRFSGKRISPPIPSAPRILILSASVGSGHIRAAQAIESVLQQNLPDAAVTHVDVLDLTNSAFRRAYSNGYFRTVEAAPSLVRLMYDRLDHPSDGRLADRVRRVFERLNFSRLTSLLTDQPWDLAISTHFLPAGLIAWLRRNGRANFPHATVITDFGVHGMWVNHPCEQYFVATPDAQAELIGWGVQPQQVRVTGIPIDPRFSQPIDPITARLRFGLAMDRPVVLQMAGGFGVGPIETIFRSICDVSTPLQLVVVAGKNAEARRRLESLPPIGPHWCQFLEYTHDMQDLMAAADIVVSKPGGLTTSESLASGCAMVVVQPIPGQEDRNAEFLMENSCAIKVNHLSSLSHKLGALLADRPRLARMRRSARHCGRPRAAFDVAAACADLLHLPAPTSTQLALA